MEKLCFDPAKLDPLKGQLKTQSFITCHFCGFERNAGNGDATEVAARLYQWGWRVVAWRKMKACACPSCAKNPNRSKE